MTHYMKNRYFVIYKVFLLKILFYFYAKGAESTEINIKLGERRDFLRRPLIAHVRTILTIATFIESLYCQERSRNLSSLSSRVPLFNTFSKIANIQERGLNCWIPREELLFWTVSFNYAMAKFYTHFRICKLYFVLHWPLQPLRKSFSFFLYTSSSVQTHWGGKIRFISNIQCLRQVKVSSDFFIHIQPKILSQALNAWWQNVWFTNRVNTKGKLATVKCLRWPISL